MRKLILLACMAVAMTFPATDAMAESIKGKVGITVRGGFIGVVIEDQTGWAANAGFIYGLTDNLAVEADATYSEYDLEDLGVKVAKAKTIDASLGIQCRFIPKSSVVPYVGAGFDVILNEFKDDAGSNGDLGTDKSFGGHLSVGVDIFMSKHVALNAEFKGVLATKARIRHSSGDSGEQFNPSNFSGLFGLRVFF